MRERFGAIIITRSLDCMTDTLGREKYNESQCQLRVTNLRRRVHGKVLKIQFYSNLSSESHGGGGGAGGNKTESLTGPSAKAGSEGIAGSDVLKLLGDLRWSPVQFFRNVFLFVRLHGVKLLTQISINHILRGSKVIEDGNVSCSNKGTG